MRLWGEGLRSCKKISLLFPQPCCLRFKSPYNKEKFCLEQVNLSSVLASIQNYQVREQLHDPIPPPKKEALSKSMWIFFFFLSDGDQRVRTSEGQIQEGKKVLKIKTKMVRYGVALHPFSLIPKEGFFPYTLSKRKKF